MRKVVIGFLILLLTTPAIASKRGVLTNTYASWVSVENNAQKTVTFPANSRDIWVSNGSAVDVCVSLDGSTFGADCYEDVAATNNDTFQLGAGQDLHFQDFISDSVTLRSAAATASPISVIITY